LVVVILLAMGAIVSILMRVEKDINVFVSGKKVVNTKRGKIGSN